MRNYIRKAEAARILKVSAPTLRKFLHGHKQVVEGRFVDVHKLDNIIVKESEAMLQKKGK